MQKPILTVGMPTFDDYDGVFFSLQSLRMHHPEVQDRIEFLVVDNKPDSNHGRTVEKLLRSVPNGRYIAESDWQGPWVKDLVIRRANTPYALCMDGHVLLTTGSLAKLVAVYDKFEAGEPVLSDDGQELGHSDLFHGPLVYDNLHTVSTHFDLVWRGQMWGIWATDPRGRNPESPPFEIPAQGMGLFSCRTDAWTSVGGFNRRMRGFGGEEGYIHTKFRQAGRKAWCLPFLRWLHRFDRPAGVHYPLTWEAKVRNYFIGFMETGLDVTPIIDHFEKACPYASRPAILALLESVKRELQHPAPPHPVASEDVASMTRPFIPRPKHADG